jgi:hypothetical protein
VILHGGQDRKKLLQKASGRSKRRVVAQTARKVRDKKEDAAIARANAMLDKMMQKRHHYKHSKSKERNNEKEATVGANENER